MSARRPAPGPVGPPEDGAATVGRTTTARPDGPSRRRLLQGLGAGALGLAALPLAGCALDGALADGGGSGGPGDDLELSFLIAEMLRN